MIDREYHRLLIGGRWAQPSDAGRYTIRSPHNGGYVGSAPIGSAGDINRAVEAARLAFDRGDWPRLPVGERVAYIRRFTELYSAHFPDMADLLVAEMGAPSYMFRFPPKPQELLGLDWWLHHAGTLEMEEMRNGFLLPKVLVRREAAGVVGIILPWNGPQVMLVAKLIPALIAGCTVVVKTAPETPLDALGFASLLEKVGLPDGVVSFITGGAEAGERLVTHPDVDRISFTGSSATGRRIAAACGPSLKRFSLELGGKSAAVILEDADLDATMRGLRFAALANSGQGCVCQTRILAPSQRYAQIVDALATMMTSLSVGDPSDLATDIGPMVSKIHRDRVLGFIDHGIAEGARLIVGGAGAPRGLDCGWYVKPTLFADVDNDMRIAREEIFGPVLSVIPYESVEDAIRLANASDYGLAGSVWTRDEERGLEVAGRIRAGTFGINGYAVDFAAPFGGFKASGIGREFGPEGLLEFSESRSIVVMTATPAPDLATLP